MATSKVNPQLNDLPPVVRDALLKCTPQQQRFVIAYCSYAAGNGTLAVKMAGGKGDYGSRAAQASDMLRLPEVAAARDAWMTTYAMQASEVTHRIADMANCSLEPFIEIAHGGSAADPKPRGKKGKKGGRTKRTLSAVPNGALVLREQTDESWARHAHWIKDIEVDPKTGRITKLRVHDRGKYLEMMAKTLKLYSDAPQVNLFMWAQSLSDEELLKEHERATREAGVIPLSRN